eukprot:8764387-Lingulodinium_polyedra.AAC.1
MTTAPRSPLPSVPRSSNRLPRPAVARLASPPAPSPRPRLSWRPRVSWRPPRHSLPAPLGAA